MGDVDQESELFDLRFWPAPPEFAPEINDAKKIADIRKLRIDPFVKKETPES